jgi:bacterioferritin-associated ferredoxin
MPRVFIFAQQVKEVLDAGNKEIEIPEGAQLSAAAADLIKDNKLKIKRLAPGAKPGANARQSAGKPEQHKTEVRPTARELPVSETAGVVSSTKTGAEISEELLEDLVNRVVDRFKQLKGMGPTQTTNKKSEPAETRQAPVNDDDVVICRCEEITRDQIKDAIRNGMQTLNGIKRITRAGMGLCQGETCQRLVAKILAQELNLSPAEVEPTTARGPVRPLRLEVFANS